VEYKTEGHKMFKKLLSQIESAIVNTLMNVRLQPAAAPLIHADENTADSRRFNKNKPGRNDPCPCGKINPKTGKPVKYKKCCWPKYG